jgi:hypothetical protein
VVLTGSVPVNQAVSWYLPVAYRLISCLVVLTGSVPVNQARSWYLPVALYVRSPRCTRRDGRNFRQSVQAECAVHLGLARASEDDEAAAPAGSSGRQRQSGHSLTHPRGQGKARLTHAGKARQGKACPRRHTHRSTGSSACPEEQRAQSAAGSFVRLGAVRCGAVRCGAVRCDSANSESASQWPTAVWPIRSGQPRRLSSALRTIGCQPACERVLRVPPRSARHEALRQTFTATAMAADDDMLADMTDVPISMQAPRPHGPTHTRAGSRSHSHTPRSEQQRVCGTENVVPNAVRAVQPHSTTHDI